MLFLFDIDGTLIKGAGAGPRALERATAAVLGDGRAARGLRLHGMTDRLIADEIILRTRGRAAAPEEREALLDAYLAELRLAVVELPYLPLPGVAAALDALAAAGATLGLCTGNLAAGARLKLAPIGLWERFAFGGFGDDGHARADIVAAAIRRAGRAFPAEQVFVVGDTPLDVAGADANGVLAIAVATGPSSVAELTATGARHVLASLEAFPALLEKLR
jgi:phosphoglycolate phosphatase-like HAD superfamily hydrolase